MNIGTATFYLTTYRIANIGFLRCYGYPIQKLGSGRYYSYTMVALNILFISSSVDN